MSETKTTEILVFDVSGQRFGLHTQHVREVLRAVTVSPLATHQAAVEGVINLRGQIVPVLDIRALFDLTAKPIEHTDHLIVVQAGNRAVMIRADRAVDVLRLNTQDVEGTANVVSGVKWINAIAKTPAGLVNIVEPQSFLSCAEALLSSASALNTSTTAEVAD